MRARGFLRIGYGILWLAAMAAVGVATYSVLATKRSHPARAATAPHETTPIFKLPGTLFLAHKGGIYRMQDGVFAELQKPNGWSQPTMAPDGRHLAAVRRNELNYSDLYLLDPGSGQITNALTHNASSVVELNQWSFYPRFSNNGGDIFFSWDNPKDFTYRVDLAVWEVPVGQPLTKAIQWTVPNDYTGGDVSPVPLKDGGLIYVKYAVDDKGQSYSQVWLSRHPKGEGQALTAAADSCAQPALSPDQTQLAMICSANKRDAKLVVAGFDGSALVGGRTLLDGQLAAAPTWAPDGSGVVYFAPAQSASSAGHFQLWWMATPPLAAVTSPGAGAASPVAVAPTPSPRQVTSNLEFDPLSPAAWSR